jgi:hypothetical protein
VFIERTARLGAFDRHDDRRAIQRVGLGAVEARAASAALSGASGAVVDQIAFRVDHERTPASVKVGKREPRSELTCPRRSAENVQVLARVGDGEADPPAAPGDAERLLARAEVGRRGHLPGAGAHEAGDRRISGQVRERRQLECSR